MPKDWGVPVQELRELWVEDGVLGIPEIFAWLPPPDLQPPPAVEAELLHRRESSSEEEEDDWGSLQRCCVKWLGKTCTEI